MLTAAVTGFLSHAAYDPDLGRNHPGGPSGSFDLYFFDWPSSPAWLYALTQGLHVISGIAAIPLLLAKLWSVIPKLFEWPPARSIAHALERLSLTFLVGGSLFVLFTGVLNIQLYYPWKFNFLSSHYYGAFVFLAALALHVGVKLRLSLRTFRRLGVLSPLRADLARTRAEFAAAETSAPSHPAPPTMSRRGLIGLVGAGSAGLGLITAGRWWAVRCGGWPC